METSRSVTGYLTRAKLSGSRTDRILNGNKTCRHADGGCPILTSQKNNPIPNELLCCDVRVGILTFHIAARTASAGREPGEPGHLIAVPRNGEALARSLKHAHGRYAAYWNARRSSSGHVWQGRFFSCPLDQSHLWRALRYVELNPVRAGMVSEACLWRWSSAGAHCGLGVTNGFLEIGRLAKAVDGGGVAALHGSGRSAE
jgi:hypothetical protein